MSTDTLRLILNIFTALCGAGGLGLILKYKLGTRKLDLDSEEAIRDHYSKEVERLTKKLDGETERFQKLLFEMEEHYRKMLEDSDRRHEECQRDRDAMRREMDTMHLEIRGLKRQIAEASADKVLFIDQAPEAIASAKRVKRITGGNDGPND